MDTRITIDSPIFFTCCCLVWFFFLNPTVPEMCVRSVVVFDFQRSESSGQEKWVTDSKKEGEVVNPEAALAGWGGGSTYKSKVRILSAICLEKRVAERQLFLSLLLWEESSAAVICRLAGGTRAEQDSCVLPILVMTSTRAQGGN